MHLFRPSTETGCRDTHVNRKPKNDTRRPSRHRRSFVPIDLPPSDDRRTLGQLVLDSSRNVDFERVDSLLGRVGRRRVVPGPTDQLCVVLACRPPLLSIQQQEIDHFLRVVAARKETEEEEEEEEEEENKNKNTNETRESRIESIRIANQRRWCRIDKRQVIRHSRRFGNSVVMIIDQLATLD